MGRSIIGNQIHDESGNDIGGHYKRVEEGLELVEHYGSFRGDSPAEMPSRNGQYILKSVVPDADFSI
jgi:hypothetical protein